MQPSTLPAFFHSRPILLICAALVVASAATVLVSGCSDDSSGVAEPQLGAVPEHPSSSFEIDHDAVIAVDPEELWSDDCVVTGGPKDLTGIFTWERSVNVHSGRATVFPLSRELTLLFPDGAVAEDTEVTAQVWVVLVQGKTQWIAFEFGPSMEFDVPVMLDVRTNLISDLAFPGGAFVLWYLNEDAWMWECSDVAWSRRGSVTFEIEHFSKYAIGR
jgi:hypothetical protein